MKLTTMTQVTVDGVVQGNGGASEEDRRNGFERGGWARGAGDDETRTLITRTYQRADAFLFGRRTYELFVGSWGAIEEMRAHPVGVALNKTPKYVASTTLTEPRWADTTVLSGDLAAAIGELKAESAGELQVHSATYRASDGALASSELRVPGRTTYSATPSAQTMPGSGNQIQPHTRMRSSASDDLHCTVIMHSRAPRRRSHSPMIASAVPDPSRDMQHNDSAHATAVLVASRAGSTLARLSPAGNAGRILGTWAGSSGQSSARSSPSGLSSPLRAGSSRRSRRLSSSG